MPKYQYDGFMKERISEIPIANQPPPLDDKRLTESDLATLDAMDADALRLLIQRVSGAMWGIGLKTREEIAEAFKLKLAISGMTERDMFKALPIMREWFDRELGKATQFIHQTNENISKTSASELSNAQLYSQLKALNDAKQLPPGVLLLEDGTLTIENDIQQVVTSS